MTTFGQVGNMHTVVNLLLSKYPPANHPRRWQRLDIRKDTF